MQSSNKRDICGSSHFGVIGFKETAKVFVGQFMPILRFENKGKPGELPI